MHRHTRTNRWRWHLLAFATALLLQLAALTTAHANDIRVWVNTSSGVYHCPGGQYYANTKRGKFLSESEAIHAGYRAAYHRPCSPEVARRTRDDLAERLTPASTGGTVTVWINTSSNVYHCPGTRYYGATKRGRYASEAEAIAAGNRPAYGQRC